MARPAGDVVERWDRFLKHYAETGRVTESASMIGVTRSAHMKRLRGNAEYAEKFADAHAAWVEKLEAEAIRRAYEGVEKDTGWYKGVPGGKVTEYSDDLLKTLLKANAPDKYGDKVEHRGVLAKLDYSRLTDEQLDRLAAGENPMSVLGAGIRMLPVLEAEVVDDEDEG